MIILDLSQIMMANVAVMMPPIKKGTIITREDLPDLGLLRHQVLNSIRGYNHRFSDEFGELVIATDSGSYWRKDIFPYYKANRKKNREESQIDWSYIYENFNIIRDEVQRYFQFRVINVDKAEGDDVIGALCHEFGNTPEKILIVSGDRDFLQLQSYMNIQQFHPIQKKFMMENNPEAYLKEHIIRGDSSDGVPNFMSPDDKFITGERAKPVSKKNLEIWLKQDPEEFCDEVTIHRYKRNDMMVNLWNIPKEIQEKIIEIYNSEGEKKPEGDLLSYFMKSKLKHLLSDIGQFKVKR